MKYGTSCALRFILKTFVYVSLLTFSYFYQITEVLQKYEEDLTNIAISEETIHSGVKPPFMTLCFVPRHSTPRGL